MRTCGKSKMAVPKLNCFHFTKDIFNLFNFGNHFSLVRVRVNLGTNLGIPVYHKENLQLSSSVYQCLFTYLHVFERKSQNYM